jgi:hypothetical protein
LYKEGTQSYFGETYNGSDWYSDSSGKEYLAVSIQSGKAWSGEVMARVGDPSVSDYDGQGAYKMRIRRYTSSGGAGSEDPNNSSVSIVISVPTPTPIPTPVEMPTNTPTETIAPEQSPATPTPTPKSTPKLTTTPTPKVTLKPTLKPASNATAATSSSRTKIGDVLGEVSESAKVQNLEITPQEVKIASEKSNSLLPKILILIGIVFLIACAIVVSYPYFKNLRQKNTDE